MIIIIDNQDSFTYNLVHYFEQLDGKVLVFQKNELTATQIEALGPDLIVLSPGPGRPAADGASPEVLRKLSGRIPIFGVCLGHQTIIEHFGGRIVKASTPMHGKVSMLTHDGKGLFNGISNPSAVTRYHSLVAEEPLPECLSVTARSEDGAIMAVRHHTLPVEGIQFHPESILTVEGFAMLKNSYEHAKQWNANNKGGADFVEPLPSV
ncbi:anthranilate synthase/aminodeoxychorismate synthase-like glutamine amidotransferase [Planomicrobium stackebrandtii]|uniref:Anthranilate synthase/aminodeoxychorismate synthase-like glutamine amidotransferase n=1 Tax=Planomicrobium stackebrandtii TaxID=253160 RepID=A0ABU0GVF5_9BACL|nr:aminodeoxychorismate/anthranilate synthase component II [Planomicrobium stackebrandtii]MDQ0429345.1 anthranilate synthase/aminodeoxychorismate synthase-like glutamine amidotransferase [Planomicrobium stackebrandtii]